jgi:hypothetical protein
MDVDATGLKMAKFCVPGLGCRRGLQLGVGGVKAGVQHLVLF